MKNCRTILENGGELQRGSEDSNVERNNVDFHGVDSPIPGSPIQLHASRCPIRDHYVSHARPNQLHRNYPFIQGR